MESLSPKRQTTFAVIKHPTEDKILLGLRQEAPMWYFSGGNIDIGENAHEALRREIKEETDLDAAIVQSVGTMIYRNSKGIEKSTVFYLCQARSDNPMVTDEEVAWNWFSPDQLPDNLFAPFRPVIQDALAGKTDQHYERTIGGNEFCLSLHADQMHGLQTWLTHPLVVARAQKGELDFPVEDIKGIAAYRDGATTIQYRHNTGLITGSGTVLKPVGQSLDTLRR